MGYSLTIGEAKLEKWDEDEFGDGHIDITVDGVHLDDAPAFGEPTDYTNERWPSYTSWWEFAEYAGLTDVLFDPETNGGIRGGHPGHFLITEKFKQDIDDAYSKFMEKYPDATPTYDTEGTADADADGALCRLTWLQYWTTWALENCENPIFKNT